MELAQHCFFHPFPEESRQRLLAATRVLRFPTGEVLFQEDAPSDAVFLVLSGTVALEKRTHHGHAETLAVMHEGEYFGEMGVIDRTARSASARVERDALLARVPGDLVIEELRRGPASTCLHFVHRVSEYLRTTNARFVAQVLQKERMHVVGEMASSIIHDFKNPMTSIRLAIEMISEKVDDPLVTRYCDLIMGQLRLMYSMAEELLTYSHGFSELQRERLTAAQLLREFHTYNEDSLARSHVTLVVDADQTPIEVDRIRFLRVLQNLLNNAAEAMGEKGGTVTIRARAEEGSLRVEVSDDGPGIPEAIRARVFEPFVTHGKRHGTGLGMAIARSIVEAHGGTIDFQTESGKGTTFTIKVPCLAPGASRS